MSSDPCSLTPREYQVLKLISLGLTNGDIAVRLGVKLRTVGTYTLSIYSKLNVYNRTAAMVKYQQMLKEQIVNRMESYA